jgi:hypothetical protein
VAAPGRPSLLASVVYARVVTDAKGADVECSSPPTPQRGHGTLQVVAQPFSRHRDVRTPATTSRRWP